MRWTRASERQGKWGGRERGPLSFPLSLFHRCLAALQRVQVQVPASTPMLLLNDYCTRLGMARQVKELPAASPPHPPGSFLTEISVSRGPGLPTLAVGTVSFHSMVWGRSEVASRCSLLHFLPSFLCMWAQGVWRSKQLSKHLAAAAVIEALLSGESR
jgi:hypothetical protein